MLNQVLREMEGIQGTVRLEEIAARLNLEPGALEGMIAFRVSKGRLAPVSVDGDTAACTTACPSFWAQPGYVGPAAIVNAHRFIFDSRDHGDHERLEILADEDGVWRCRTIFNCTDACPRGIHITQAIMEVSTAIGTRRR